jgi:hypothetical protein
MAATSENAMNKIVLSTLVASVVAGLGGYGLSNYANAQGTQPAQVTNPAPVQGGPDGWADHRPGGWRDRHLASDGMHHFHRHMTMARNWGLFARQPDKRLTEADVQTLAQAMLLRHGNHAWKVTEVTQNQNDTASFAFATQSGDVIARFTMNERTGHLRRVG